MRFAALAATALLSSAALAANPAPVTAVTAGTPGHWSISTGETVSPSHDALAFELGWPGISAGYLHGLSENTDIGVKFDLLYGWENTTNSKFGLGLRVPLRMVVKRKDNLLVELHVEPGTRIYTNSASTDFFLRFPVGGTVGIQAAPEVRIAVGVDYLVDKNLIVGLNTRFGPQFYTVSNSNTDFAFTTQIVVGSRL